jgi:hypothetical protein
MEGLIRLNCFQSGGNYPTKHNTNTSCTIVLYYKLQHVSAVQISRHQVNVGYTQQKA